MVESLDREEGYYVFRFFNTNIHCRVICNNKDEFYNLQGLLENLNEFNNKETVKFLEFEINKY